MPEQYSKSFQEPVKHDLEIIGCGHAVAHEAVPISFNNMNAAIWPQQITDNYTSKAIISIIVVFNDSVLYQDISLTMMMIIINYFLKRNKFLVVVHGFQMWYSDIFAS